MRNKTNIGGKGIKKITNGKTFNARRPTRTDVNPPRDHLVRASLINSGLITPAA